jgi:hypothetical protein
LKGSENQTTLKNDCRKCFTAEFSRTQRSIWSMAGYSRFLLVRNVSAIHGLLAFITRGKLGSRLCSFEQLSFFGQHGTFEGKVQIWFCPFPLAGSIQNESVIARIARLVEIF